MPPATTDAQSYITSNWFASNFYASENLEFSQDPVDTNSTIVLRANYPAGSYAPVGAKNGGVKGGADFYSAPNGQTQYNTALLSYEVAFDSNFDWVKGGKLPGIYGGDPKEGCAGGEKATGNNCFSVRMMWREGGAGEAYAYIPTSDSLCSSNQVICNSDYGTSFSRGVIHFSTMKWTRIEMYVKANSGSDSNGILQVWQDNSLVINRQDIQFRANQSLGISNWMFSTFFGGGSSSYATPVNTSTYYRNFEFSTGNTPGPVGASAVLQRSSLPYYVVFLVLLYHCAL
ncbi:hypothetical protein G6F56_006207 [Rhizopus delemar]|uniref:Polysaccharide lyase 14 domain-containing protein n=1 Tax=Rhizopus stolonifer TaxID=4846 RepID=A0A367KM48_RHIST|nr:hypothetical protein G6F56_006207 [Rhizopus delemar]RCI03231.1 hypothetical protein CU098_011886 [Rhizopus stolonifer]